MLQYRREIDGLRAVALIPVILFHAKFQFFSGGYVGVDVFFVISGYLITSIILTEHKTGSFTFAGFYERRARRILPALFFVIVCCFPFAWFWMLPYQLEDFSQSVMAVSVFSSNILFWREMGYFNLETIKPLLHTWSLSVEEQYYLIFPIILILILKSSRKVVIATFITITVASLLLSEWGWRNHPNANFFLTPSRAWELMIGVLLALYLFSHAQPHGKINQIASSFGLLMVMYAVSMFNESTPSPSSYTLIPTLGAALIILYATPDTLVGKLLSMPVFVKIGLISYSAYLWHQPLFEFARLRGVDIQFNLLTMALIISTLLIAYGSWNFVEKPFRTRSRFTQKQIFQWAILISILYTIIGFYGYLSHGFIDRFPKADRYLISLNIHEQGRYVSQRFVDRIKNRFSADDKREKLLLVGDSFAHDFLNMAVENQKLSSFEIVTFPIIKQCGLYLGKQDVTQHIPTIDRPTCEKAKKLSDIKQTLLKQADVIILAASWIRWVAEQLPTTIQNLNPTGNKQVIVIGTKNFGDINPLLFIGTTRDYRLSFGNPIKTSPIKINTFMKNTLNKQQFVDVHQLICKHETQCPVFTFDERLISHDGQHVTKEGAKYVGNIIFNSSVLNRLQAGTQ